MKGKKILVKKRRVNEVEVTEAGGGKSRQELKIRKSKRIKMNG